MVRKTQIKLKEVRCNNVSEEHLEFVREKIRDAGLIAKPSDGLILRLGLYTLVQSIKAGNEPKSIVGI